MAKFRSDKRKWERVKRNLSKKKYMLNVGWFSGQKYGADNNHLPMAQVAQWVEEGKIEGFGPTPPRPAIRVKFMPSLFKDSDLLDKAKLTAFNVAEGRMSWRTAHVAFADDLVVSLQRILYDYHDIPNSPATIAIKGFDNPWVRTGQLIESVTYKVEDYKRYVGAYYK